MSLRPRSFLSLLALLSISLSASAEGLVQLTLNGELEAPGGGPVEIHVGFWDGQEVVPVDFHLHLAERTSAHDVAHLLVSRLRAAGAAVQFPGETAGRRDLAQLFVEDATLVSFRLGRGLWATVTSCDPAAATVLLQPPLEVEKPAELSVTVSTFHPHTKAPGRIQFSHRAAAKTTRIEISLALFERGLEEGLLGDRPGPELWRVAKTEAGALVTGCSFRLHSPEGDWGMELRLPVPEE